MNKLTLINLPIFITLIRLLTALFLLPFLFTYIFALNSIVLNILLAIFFILISITDFFDGFLARKYGQETIIGGLLDPVADKFLLLSSIVTLVYINKIFFYIAIIFLAREFFVMGLRQYALMSGIKINVIKSAKIKTFMQFLYLTIVIINNNLYLLNILEYIFLFIALFFSLFSLLEYYLIFMNNVRYIMEVKK